MADESRQKVTIALDSDLFAAVEQRANEERNSVSGVIRSIIARWARQAEHVRRATA
jgi:hypothetical protein